MNNGKYYKIIGREKLKKVFRKVDINKDNNLQFHEFINMIFEFKRKY
jgi:hypothetical protein